MACTLPWLTGTSALLLLGCASPGPPRPPSLHLPRVVRDLQAVREGNRVLLQWTAPTETSDGLLLQHRHQPMPLMATVCRVEGTRCVDFYRERATPGESMATADTLPVALTAGAPRAVRYRVRVSNAAGRDAGASRDAVAAAGEAPAAVTALSATTVAAGLQLTWQTAPGDGRIRVEAQTGAAPGGTSRPVARLLQVSPVSGAHDGRAVSDPGGAVDAAAPVGAAMHYRVYRQQTVTVDGETVTLRGEPAEVRTVRSADTFPPAQPVGLLAESFRPEGLAVTVSLSWEPNSEPDLLGYYVYRAEAGSDFARVTAKPVAGVSWDDTGVTGLVAGRHYRYQVSAVDHKGNESAHSAAVDVESR